jgi:uncharacterized protein (TIGR02284 family)
METKEQIIQLLKGLFTVCRTSEVSYRAAAEAVEGDTTSELLKSYADQRREFADELRGEIRFHSEADYQADPPVDSWKEIYEAVQSGDNEEIIRACERAESAMLRVYKNALERRIPWDVETVLAHQYSDIKKAYHFISALELFSNEFVV